jgi:putative endonuclease
MTIAKVRKLPDRAVQHRGVAVASRSRRQAEVRGRVAELIAAALLILKGYRILARRHRGPFGEIDIIATRGRRLAFVEVKQRNSAGDAAAALTATQADRLSNAVEHWLWRNPRFREHRIGLDAVVLGASLVPHHVRDALHAW